MGLASFTPVYTTQQDFILEDGTINPNSYDRLGNVRAATAFPNSIMPCRFDAN